MPYININLTNMTVEHVRDSLDEALHEPVGGLGEDLITWPLQVPYYVKAGDKVGLVYNSGLTNAYD